MSSHWHFESTFKDGVIYNSSSNRDGWSLQGECGNCGGISVLSIIESDTDPVDLSTILPRKGQFMAKMHIEYEDGWGYWDGSDGNPDADDPDSPDPCEGCADRSRIQLVKNDEDPSAGNLELEKEYWIGLSIYLPKSYHADTERELLFNIRTPGGNSISLISWEGEWGVRKESVGGWPFSGTQDGDRGKWTDWFFNVRLSTGSSGFLNIYKNNVLVAEDSGANFQSTDLFPTITIRIYKPTWRSTPSFNVDTNEKTLRRTVYFDQIRITDTTGEAGRQELVDALEAEETGVTARNDSYTTPSDTVLNVAAPGVLDNDSGSGLSASLVTDVSHGILTLNPDGSFSYDPNGTAETSDSFEYQATDGTNTDNATVSISIDQQATDGTLSLAAPTAQTGTQSMTGYGNWSLIGFDSETQQVDKDGQLPFIRDFTFDASLDSSSTLLFSWSSGNQIAQASDQSMGWRTTTIGHKYTFRIPSGTTERTDSIWVQVSGVDAGLKGRFSASMSDNSAISQNVEITSPGEATTYRIDITHQSGDAGAEVICEWELLERPVGGSLTMIGAATDFSTPEPNDPPSITSVDDVYVRLS